MKPLTTMRIPHVGKLIAGCWAAAEDGVREKVRALYPDRDEEFITGLLHGELALNFDKVSRAGTVAKAFLSDLELVFPTITLDSLCRIAQGLIATVSFHPREIEGKTGGDLGIVVIRPDVQGMRFSGQYLTVDHDYRRGLLCQAKIFRRNSRWKGLSSNQQRTLLGKLSYFGLLLYRYADQEADRRNLKPFAWQLAHEATIQQIQSWFASDCFPDPLNSRQVIQALINGKIGTDDKELIGKDIAPRLRRSLTITIRWKDGDDPGNRVRVQERPTTVHLKQEVVVRR